MSEVNIFTNLERYTGENFLTQSLVYLIKHLLNTQTDRHIGIEIINKLCCTDINFPFEDNESIDIVTQETIKEGRLDIRILSSTNKVIRKDIKNIYIEVKDTSDVYPEQLRKYKKDLQRSEALYKVLVLLTRYSIDEKDHQNIPDKFILWNEVHGWIKGARSDDPISSYLIDSFKMFLEGKQMSINRVTSEYENGVLALNNLMQMIERAIIGIPARIGRGGRGKGYTGYYFEDSDFFCGIWNHEPSSVKFEIECPKKFDRDKLKESIYSMHEGTGILYFDLPLEDIHFFSLDADKQMEEITKFVKNCYNYSQKLRR